MINRKRNAYFNNNLRKQEKYRDRAQALKSSSYSRVQFSA